jgi:hypothetical protein
MNFTVTVEAPELVGALNKLAEALGNSNPLSGVSIGTESKVFTAGKKIEEPKPKVEEPPVEEPPFAPIEEPPAEEEAPEELVSTISLDVLTTKTREFIQANPANRTKLKSFLDEKQVKKITELAPADYEAALHFMEVSAE